MEEWRPSKKYEQYELSTEGSIRNIKTGRILKTSINKNGYEQVCIRKDNKQHTERVHRLMLDAFRDELGEASDVYHKNRNRSDNRLSNLEACSKSDTCKRAFREGSRVGRGSIRVRVIETGRHGEEKVIGEFYSIRECARSLGITDSMVSRCMNGLVKTCLGYKIERIE